MHNTLGVAEIQRFQQLCEIILNIANLEGWVQLFELGVVHVLENQRRRFGVGVPHHVHELDDVGSAAQVLQDWLPKEIQIEKMKFLNVGKKAMFFEKEKLGWLL